MSALVPTGPVLSSSDINTTINGEPRIQDLRLAEALGFSKPLNIRDLIDRHANSLQEFGELFFRTVRKNTRGRPGKEYWLTEKQALYLCTKSEAPNAIDITIEMVEVFHAVKTGTVPVKAHRRRKQVGIALGLTDSTNAPILIGGVSTSFTGGHRHRYLGGIFVPALQDLLWREAGSGNAPTCPVTSATSRHPWGLAASKVAKINALLEADMSAIQQNESVLVSPELKTTSLCIAAAFGKNHKDVLRKVEALQIPKDFNERNFALVEYTDVKGEARPCYEMTRDGFSLLVMGFTGKKAMAWKIKFLEAFNAMEKELATIPVKAHRRRKPVAKRTRSEFERLIDSVALRVSEAEYRNRKEHREIEELRYLIGELRLAANGTPTHGQRALQPASAERRARAAK